MALTKEERAAVARANIAKARAAKAQRLAAEAAAPKEEPALMPPLQNDDGAEMTPAMPIDEPMADRPLPQDAFERFMAALDEETRELLSEAELRAIFSAQEKKAQDERRTRAQKAASERALHHAKVEAGLLPTTAVAEAAWQERMRKKVRFTPDLPELGDIGLRVDGVIYLHGRETVVTMAQYLSFREMEWRNKQAELDFEGRSRLHHLRRQAGALNVHLNGTAA